MTSYFEKLPAELVNKILMEMSIVNLIETQTLFKRHYSDPKFWKNRLDLYYGSDEPRHGFNKNKPIKSYINAIFTYLPEHYSPNSYYTKIYKRQMLNANIEYKELKNKVLQLIKLNSKKEICKKEYYKLTYYKGDYFGAKLDNIIFNAHNLSELFLKIRNYLLKHAKNCEGKPIDFYDTHGDTIAGLKITDNVFDSIIKKQIDGLISDNDTLWVTKLETKYVKERQLRSK